MSLKILVVNSGSSSLKYSLFDLAAGEQALAAGQIERIGEAADTGAADHRQAVQRMVWNLAAAGALQEVAELNAIGHRVVHGGERFSAATAVDTAVLAAIREAIPLAPLHNPPNLLGIELCREFWPGVPQVAVFDTAFHQTMPPEAYRYALPEACYRDYRIRRYGFHGTSFAALTRQTAAYLGVPREQLNLIALHLGNGASVAAIRSGRSVDTSMGLTPLAGLMMGTRCGDLDPGAVLHLLEQRGLSVAAVSALLNQQSGLKGVAGHNDMRDVLAAAAQGDEAARLALAIYVYRIRHYIGAYFATLGRVDALVFTGGIGEHAAPIRRDVCVGLEMFGIQLDPERNERAWSGIAEIQADTARLKILLIPAAEELEIARQTAQVIHEHSLQPS